MKAQIKTKVYNSKKERDKGGIIQQSAVDKFEHLEKKQNKITLGWQETFDAALDIIALISADFEILKLNKAGYENIGRKPEELIGKKCYEVVHGLDSPIDGCPCAKALKVGTGGSGEIRDHGKIYMATASPILGKNKEIVAFAHTVKDITAQKETEKILRNAQKDLEQKVKERTADL